MSDLHDAVIGNNLSEVKTLLDQDHDPNTFDEIGFTPLHHVAKNGQLEMVRLLLKAGADVNAHDESQIGNNPSERSPVIALWRWQSSSWTRVLIPHSAGGCSSPL